MYILNNYNKLYNYNNILKIYYYIKNYPFIIFVNNKQFNNRLLLNLKIELLKLNNKCITINTLYIKYIFNYKSFKFLGVNTLMFLFKDFKDFILFENYFNNMKLFYSYKYNFGMTKLKLIKYLSENMLI